MLTTIKSHFFSTVYELTTPELKITFGFKLTIHLM